MTVSLPDIPQLRFGEELRGIASESLPAATVERLHSHYEELRRWSGRLSLVGPGAAADVLSRHFGESLAGLRYLPAETDGRLVDVGSGAGFPGLVIAAARPRWRVTLVEARQRKWAFLQAAARRAGLACHCLNARVGSLLPPGLPDAYEAVTVRALSLPPPVLAALASRLTAGGCLLLWAGAEEPSLPAGLRLTGETPLPGSRVRRLLVVEQA